MKSFVLTVFLLFTLIPFVQGQATVTESGGIILLNKNEVSSQATYRRGVYVGEHILGEEVTNLMGKFESAYVYYVPSTGAYSSDVQRINKPAIYKAIKKLDRYYTKAVNKGKVDRQLAGTKMEELLKVGVKLIGFQTEAVEEKLKTLKDLQEIEKYLLELKFLS